MSDDENTRRVCQKHEALEVSLERLERTTREGFAEINSGLRAVLKDLREGAVEIATMKLRILMLERWVYSAMATALAGLVAAVLAMVLKGGA